MNWSVDIIELCLPSIIFSHSLPTDSITMSRNCSRFCGRSTYVKWHSLEQNTTETKHFALGISSNSLDIVLWVSSQASRAVVHIQRLVNISISRLFFVDISNSIFPLRKLSRLRTRILPRKFCCNETCPQTFDRLDEKHQKGAEIDARSELKEIFFSIECRPYPHKSTNICQ